MSRALLWLLVLGLSIAGPLFADDKSPERQGPEWVVSEEVYGLIRLVPEPEVPHLASVRDWEGLWDRNQRFFITVNFSRGRQTKPEVFEFVDPDIGIRGQGEKSSSGLSAGVTLFQKASTASDVQIDFQQPPEVIKLEHDYLAAEVYGEGAITRWKVYVRFTTQQTEKARKAAEKSAISRD